MKRIVPRMPRRTSTGLVTELDLVELQAAEVGDPGSVCIQAARVEVAAEAEAECADLAWGTSALVEVGQVEGAGAEASVGDRGSVVLAGRCVGPPERPCMAWEGRMGVPLRHAVDQQLTEVGELGVRVVAPWGWGPFARHEQT